MSSGNDGKPDEVGDGRFSLEGRLSMNERTSLSIVGVLCDWPVILPSFELESLNSKVEGTVVVGASA